MKTELIKHDLISWISELQDVNLIKKLHKLRLTFNLKNRAPENKKRGLYGSGKDIVTYVADDFNAPLDDMFKNYIK